MNLLRNFGVDVPAEVLRTRNVAAVLVTAEASAFLRPGGRFEVSVASVGDAVSLRGGVLWATPLVYEIGGPPVGTAQGPLLLSEGRTTRQSYTVETSARIPAGGLLLDDLPRTRFAASSRLVLREPNIGTATRIAAAVNAAVGPGTAQVEDPGSIASRCRRTSPRRSRRSRTCALRRTSRHRRSWTCATAPSSPVAMSPWARPW